MAAAGLSALPYLGGKSAKSSRMVTQWINTLVPFDPAQTYIEPYAGMLGVLLSRPTARLEIVNDLDNRLVNWWLVVRDHNEELAKKLENTPHSRTEFNQALKNLDHEDIIERARAYTIRITQNVLFTLDTRSPSWRCTKRSCYHIKAPIDYAIIVRQLKHRLKRVQIENRDAISILKASLDLEHAMIYCDPPYNTDDTVSYTMNMNHSDLIKVLSSSDIKAKIAISGYPGDFDKLESHGWLRHTKETTLRITTTVSPRFEVLWTNYQPNSQLRLGM